MIRPTVPVARPAYAARRAGQLGRYVIFMPHAHVEILSRSWSDTYGEVAERSKAAHFGAHTGRNTITRWHTS
jgi:hypothetical protein